MGKLKTSGGRIKIVGNTSVISSPNIYFYVTDTGDGVLQLTTNYNGFSLMYYSESLTGPSRIVTNGGSWLQGTGSGTLYFTVPGSNPKILLGSCPWSVA